MGLAVLTHSFAMGRLCLPNGPDPCRPAVPYPITRALVFCNKIESCRDVENYLKRKWEGQNLQVGHVRRGWDNQVGCVIALGLVLAAG